MNIFIQSKQENNFDNASSVSICDDTNSNKVLVVKVDERGRIFLPAFIRKKYKMKKDTVLTISLEKILNQNHKESYI